MRVLLIGNYEHDRQESMQRFAELMMRELPQRGLEVRLVKPTARLGRLKPGAGGLGKWLGYVDKFALFPQDLPTHLGWCDVVHICDHSNAMYCRYLAARPTVVTCHDLLAVRGALGEDTDCPAGIAGGHLQRWILKGLHQAQVLAAVSSYTLADAQRLVQSGPRLGLVLNGLNQPFRPLDVSEIQGRIAPLLPTLGGRPYVLHVGSNLRRKNREAVLRIGALIKDRWPGDVVFAGQPLSQELRALARQLGIEGRIHDVVRPDDQQLEALYGGAHAFLFPSRYEGFGWPIIEAQACACPVVCSACGPFLEVAGDGALIHDVEDEAGMAEDILRLSEPGFRSQLVSQGTANLSRFTTDRMIDEYIALYRDLTPC
ncbi:MAG: glycosyltransferase family 4 protein [Planctomycetes bacterium]|nr:glycosyltransferase family 4 protein [Planctomycetota bacterium]